jgi:hypothetical protein
MPVTWTGQARDQLRQVRRLLLNPNPRQVERCAPLLQEAAGCLRNLQQMAQQDQLQDPAERRELRRELGEVRREMEQVQILLQNASKFYLGWAQLLGAAAQTYSADGSFGQITGPQRLSVEG